MIKYYESYGLNDLYYKDNNDNIIEFNNLIEGLYEYTNDKLGASQSYMFGNIAEELEAVDNRYPYEFRHLFGILIESDGVIDQSGLTMGKEVTTNSPILFNNKLLDQLSIEEKESLLSQIDDDQKKTIETVVKYHQPLKKDFKKGK